VTGCWSFPNNQDSPRFVALNEDVDPDDAADLLDEFGFTFPAALGRAT